MIMFSNAPEKSLNISVGGYSIAGLKAENQDAFAAFIPKPYELELKGAVTVLADGVSSAEKAAQASQLAVTQFIQEYYATPQTWSTRKSAAKVINSLNQWLFSQGGMQSDLYANEQQQWLTTFSALIVKSATGYIFHAGDSRVSQWRNNQLTALTRDHNRRQGGQSVLLTRALGADSRLEIDVHEFALQADDLYVLTCDGIHDFIPNKVLAELLAQIPAKPSTEILEQFSQKIVEQALALGSDDNVSCLLLCVQQIPQLTVAEISAQLMSKMIPPVLKIGEIIDGYKVLKVIHASTRSHLYLVKHAEQEKPVVMKTPSTNFSEDAIYLQGFSREAWLGEHVNHPHIMRIKTANTDSKFLYHLCEYIEGQTLSSWIQENPTPDMSRVLPIIEQLVSALRAFQRLDIVHRDLKPDNIMIDQYGQVKLIDYGTAFIAALNEQQQSLAETVPQGSLNYIAPETLLELKANYQSDLFSLAVICYEMLSGKTPYKPMKRAEVTFSHYHQWHYRSLKQFRPDLPVWLDLSLQQATKADPKSRYDAYSAFIADLRNPNITALESYQKQPLIERDPVKFWQITSIVLAVSLLFSLFN